MRLYALALTLPAFTAGGPSFPLPMLLDDFVTELKAAAPSSLAKSFSTVPDSSPEHLAFLEQSRGSDVTFFSDDCAAQTNCGDCTKTTSHFKKPCRWCPLTADNTCHSYGDNKNPCDTEEQQTDPDQCAPLATTRKPVVILPGLTGSVLDAKLSDKQDNPSPVCYSNTDDFFTIWLSIPQMLPEVYKCTFDEWKLKYDYETAEVQDNDGVQIQTHLGSSGYGASYAAVIGWDQIAHALLAKGYTLGTDLFSAPFDFRMGLKQFMADDFPRLKQLVETAYHSSGDQPVVFASISYGGPFGAAFLTEFVNQQWKDKYIDSWISLSGVFNGAPMVNRQLITGMPAYGIPWIPDVTLRDSMREWPSLAWLVPGLAEGGDDRVVYKTSQRQYTMSQVNDLLEDAGATAAADMIRRSENLVTDKDPGVKVHCWYTPNIPTEFSYEGESLEDEPKINYSGGDGTGDLHSLNRCDAWEDVAVVRFDGLAHAAYMGNETVTEMVVALVSK